MLRSAAVLLIVAAPAWARPHDLATIDAALTAFAGGPTKPLDRRLALPQCSDALQLGWTGTDRRAVAAACAQPPWRVIAAVRPVQSSRPAPTLSRDTTLVAARPVARGTVLSIGDVKPGNSRVPGAVERPEDALGRVVTRALATGASLRADALAPAPSVRRGVAVAIRATAPGVVVEALGSSTADAAAGVVVGAVNAATGRRLRGVAAEDGAIEVRR